MPIPTALLDDIARGDFDAACAKAVALPDPRDHRDAMIAINRARSAQPKRTTMQPPRFSLDEKKATVTDYFCDKRVSDKPDEVAPAIAVVSFKLNLAAEDALPGFSPTLRNMLFHKSGAVTHDLAAQVNDAPDVRFPNFMYPLKWKAPDDYEGATVTIHKGIGGKSDLVLEDCAVSTFEITPKQGGQVIVEFTARSPQEKGSKAFTLLPDMLKTEVSISFEPPEESDEDEGDLAGKKSASEPQQAATLQ